MSRKRPTVADLRAMKGKRQLTMLRVLTMDEAAEHPHLQARGTIVEDDGLLQPAPAPRFSRTPGAIQRPPAWPGR